MTNDFGSHNRGLTAKDVTRVMDFWCKKPRGIKLASLNSKQRSCIQGERSTNSHQQIILTKLLKYLRCRAF